MRAVGAFFLMVCLTALGEAQEVDRSGSGGWMMTSLRADGAGIWSTSLELHERTAGWFARQATAIVRPAIHAKLTPHLESAVGGSWVNTPSTGTEWNAWEQLTFKGGDADWTWATRVRQEHRWVPSESGERSRSNRIRVRVSLKRMVPIQAHPWYISGFVEWWGDQDSAYRAKLFSRTWRSLAVGRSFDSGWTVQLSALHQMDAIPSGWRISDVGQIAVLRTWN